jgi:hypothetical protein
MKTILHIGMPKTGTTALQECLRASRSLLARHGVLYPENPPGCGFNNHRILIFGFTPYGRLPRHILRQSQYTRENYVDKYREFLRNIYGQVEATRPTHTVLSSESLFNRLGPQARRSLVGALEPLGGDVTVAIYLRKPSEFYLSNIQQILKQSHDLGWLRVRATFNPVRSYAKAFGRDAIRLRTYARSMLTNGDIVEDFLASQLADLPIDAATLDRGTNTNETVSAESVDLMRRHRLAFHPDANNVSMADSTRLLRELRRIEKGTAAQKPRLRPEIAEFIDYSRADPLLLRDTYGIVFPGLDYRRLERRWLPRLPRLPRRPAGLSELMHIDAAVQREILADLLRTRWARADPARGPWIDGLLRDLRG